MPDLTAVKNALRAHRIELPSWAFGNTGTRFKVFPQPGVPRTPQEKIAANTLEALGITHAHNGLALDTPPFALYARTAKVDVVAGIRIGITKAVELPWRYGLRGSKFLSKPFTE